MKMRFKTEKHAREETIGRACDMAAAAVREKRPLSEREQRKVEALLSVAESLGLGENIPREPAELLRWGRRPMPSPVSVADLVASDPKMPKPPKRTKK